MAGLVTAPSDTLVSLLERGATEHPHSPSLFSEKHVVSYADLQARSLRYAATISSLGAAEGRCVGIFAKKDTEVVAAQYGIMRAGGAYVSIDPSWPLERVSAVIRLCDLSIVLSSGSQLDALLGGSAAESLDAIVSMDGRAAGHPKVTSPLRNADAFDSRARPDDLAYVFCTSGSTGVPKAVMLTHRQSLAFCCSFSESFEFRTDDVYLSLAPFGFDLSVIDLFVAAMTGAACLIAPESCLVFPAKLKNLIAKFSPTVWNSVPSSVDAFLRREAAPMQSFRYVFVAGEPLRGELLHRMRTSFPSARLVNVYGQTEANSSTAFDATHAAVSDQESVPIGKVFPGYEVLLVSTDGTIVEDPNVEGEILVAGDAVARGYLGDDAKTIESFVPHPRPTDAFARHVYRTRDRAFRNDVGDLVFCGRLDRVVKLRGFRVDLDEVEAVIKRMPDIGRCMAQVVHGDDGASILGVFVEGASDGLLANVRRLLSEQLPRYALPEHVLGYDRFPATNTGKVDGQRLKADLLAAVAHAATT